MKKIRMLSLSVLAVLCLAPLAYGAPPRPPVPPPPKVIDLPGGVIDDHNPILTILMPSKLMGQNPFRVQCETINDQNTDVAVNTRAVFGRHHINHFWSIFVSNARLTVSPPSAWNIHPGHGQYTVFNVVAKGFDPILTFIRLSPGTVTITHCIAKQAF
jgi:hypothetical protein